MNKHNKYRPNGKTLFFIVFVEDKAKVSPRQELLMDAETSCAVSPYDHVPAITITKASSEEDLDKLLTEMCKIETERLEQISRNHPPESPRDVRLESISIYLLRCGAPREVTKWAILKQVTENIKSKTDPRYSTTQ